MLLFYYSDSRGEGWEVPGNFIGVFCNEQGPCSPLPAAGVALSSHFPVISTDPLNCSYHYQLCKKGDHKFCFCVYSDEVPCFDQS